MSENKKSYFFHFPQNKSAGIFFVNDKVAHHIIVEALSADDANKRAKKVTAGFNAHCRCCGVRWDLTAMDDDASDFPSIYGDPVAYEKNRVTIIYYMNGDKVIYNEELIEK